MRTTTTAATTAMGIALASPLFAQTNGTYVIDSAGTVSPSSLATTVEVWARWDETVKEFFFGGSDYDLTARDGEFSIPVNVLNGPGSTTGLINGNAVTGAKNGMLMIPWLPGWPPDNPVLLATYQWTTSDFTPRTVDLVTSNTSHFTVAYMVSGVGVELYPHEFTPGAGVIHVVPAPGAILVLGLVAFGRRRGTCACAALNSVPLRIAS